MSSRTPSKGGDEGLHGGYLEVGAGKRAEDYSPPPPALQRRDSREIYTDEERGSPTSPKGALRTASRALDELRQRLAAEYEQGLASAPWERRWALVLALSGLALMVVILTAVMYNLRGRAGAGPGQQGGGRGEVDLTECSDMIPCPVAWQSPGSNGGFFCQGTGGCRRAALGPFPGCELQCRIGSPGRSSSEAREERPRKALLPKKLESAGLYDLRVVKGDRLMGCAAPVGMFPGQPKYGCAGDYATAQTCDAAKRPIKDTKYVAAVHAGCETEQGRGTYGYAYDDGVGLKQCAPVTKYEWVLCPTGEESAIDWEAKPGVHGDESTQRFRVTNHCDRTIWIQQAGSLEMMIPHEESVRRIEPNSFYTYAIPDRGLPSTRFLPKTGCDDEGNACDIQSMPPCPPEGCDLPVDTKFEASWGCKHATGIPLEDKKNCALTGQGNPSTYQDWWDGSAVDGWTLPFTVLVDDGGHGLAPGGAGGSPDICGPVVCAELNAATLCPKDEFLTPED